MAKTILTATLPNNETIKRTTERTYTHALTVETTYTDGTTGYTKAEWAGRPDLAQKRLAKLRAFAAHEAGTEVRRFDPVTYEWRGTGIYRKTVTALAIPVNA
jgi:L-alanine-DL-glutamate epimerase-like enolase superfamily enzyme